MFLNYLKYFFIKKTLKNNLLNVKNEAFTSNIQTIGVLIDESNFRYSEVLRKELISNGIDSDKIEMVVYRSKFKNKETYLLPTFGKKQINWKGDITIDFLTEFIETEFDLLISYYNIQKPVLKLVTSKSKAKFKVGFASIDKDLNHWMIDTPLENYKLFVSELFKYLKRIK